MRFRKLRIAWSVTWGLLAILLCVLWVQSYSHTMSYAVSFGRSGLCAALDSTRDRVLISASTTGGGQLQPYLPGNNRRKIDVELWNLIRASENRWGFGIYRDFTLINTSTLILPHWFLISLSVAVAAVPWVTLRRRFSLRALLIATTLVAVVLGLAVWAVRR
jgi:hypothetical protein